MNMLHVSSLLLFLILLHGDGAAACRTPTVRSCEPCKQLVVYFHDILYNGKNTENSTSAIVAAPEGRDKNILSAGQDIVLFNNPLTTDENLNSFPVGRAQGIYVYIRKDLSDSWLALSLVLNSTQHHGTIDIVGSNPYLDKTRDLSVTSGTGDFFMARGLATLSTSAVQGTAYFRVKIEVKLFECW